MHSSFRSAAGGLAAVCIFVAWCAIPGGCGKKKDPTPTPAAKGSTLLTGVELAALKAEIEPQIQASCTTCHELPHPSHAPREDWPQEVDQALNFIRQSPQPTAAPDRDKLLDYFRSLSIPEKEIAVPPRNDGGPGKLTFTRQGFDIDKLLQEPAVGGVKFLASGAEPAAILACEMRTGRIEAITAAGLREITAGSLRGETTGDRPKRPLSNPCHIEPCDLDGDGRQDLLAADLGYFLPTDDLVGRVVWLRKRADAPGYEPIDIATGLGRVADVQPGDLDGDGDQDLLVAEFGWRKAGHVLLYWNDGMVGGKLRLRKQQIDGRNGAIHVPIADLNGDGKLDFMVLLAQQHEKVLAFVNRGEGQFEEHTVHQAPHASYGSSGIQLVDVDGDADLDVLYANGDGFDRSYLKPFHSVQWLENVGKFPFVHRHLTYMPGCHRALGGDLDGDGDIDIACVAFVSPATLEKYGPQNFDGAIWLEQTEPGKFVRHPIQGSPCSHAAMDIGDFDSDGDIDIAAATFVAQEATVSPRSPAIVVWWNDRIPSDWKLAGSTDLPPPAASGEGRASP